MRLPLVLFIFSLIHCGGSTHPAVVTVAIPTYSIGGTVAGLSGTVILQNNEGNDLTLTADGDFTFATEVTDGSAYAVTVLTQPSGQACSISNSTGTVATADVTNIAIVCSANTYTVGGTVSGLSGTVVLQNNSGNDLTLTTNTTFTFSAAVADGGHYAVTISTQPASQFCTVSSGSGTISAANVSNVSMTCVSDKKIFVTNSIINDAGLVAFVSGADSKCASDSNNPGSGTYKALIVGSSSGSTRVACTTANCSGGTAEHTDWVLTPNTRYVRLDGTTSIGITTNSGIFDFSGGLTNSFGTAMVAVWTGLNANWRTGSTCDSSGSWNTGSADVHGFAGFSTATDATAIANSDDLCGSSRYLYCVEQ